MTQREDCYEVGSDIHRLYTPAVGCKALACGGQPTRRSTCGLLNAMAGSTGRWLPDVLQGQTDGLERAACHRSQGRPTQQTSAMAVPLRRSAPGVLLRWLLFFRPSVSGHAGCRPGEVDVRVDLVRVRFERCPRGVGLQHKQKVAAILPADPHTLSISVQSTVMLRGGRASRSDTEAALGKRGTLLAYHMVKAILLLDTRSGGSRSSPDARACV